MKVVVESKIMILNQEFIKSIVPTAGFLGKPLADINAWVVDSRLIQSGDMFIALPGLRTEGHRFVQDAFERGAVGAVISQSMQPSLQPVIDMYRETHSFIIVDSPYQTICAVAGAWRRQFSYPIVGLTGSAGKTTTKEMLGEILRCNGANFLLAHGTQNTLIGIAINILNMRPNHEVAIFEMGISKRGEMAQLAQLVMPTIAIITSIGHSHMEGLGSIIDIAAEKREIFKYLKDDGTGIIDGDQPLLASISYRHPVIKFGRKMINQVQARKIQYRNNAVHFQLKLYNTRHALVLATENSARVSNALAAAATAYVLGVAPDVITQGIQQSAAVSGRFKKHVIPGSQSIIIDDSYNANPESMKAALHALEKMEGNGKKIAVLGDMLELGINAPFWHRQLGRFLRKVPSLDQVIFIGEQVKWAQKMAPFGLQVHYVPSWQEAVPFLQSQMQSESLILIKGSRGIGLTQLVHELIK